MADEREFQRDVLWPKPGMGRVLKVRRIRIGLRTCKVGGAEVRDKRSVDSGRCCWCEYGRTDHVGCVRRCQTQRRGSTRITRQFPTVSFIFSFTSWANFSISSALRITLSESVSLAVLSTSAFRSTASLSNFALSSPICFFHSALAAAKFCCLLCAWRMSNWSFGSGAELIAGGRVGVMGRGADDCALFRAIPVRVANDVRQTKARAQRNPEDHLAGLAPFCPSSCSWE